jgi:hypothetical protein
MLFETKNKTKNKNLIWFGFWCLKIYDNGKNPNVVHFSDTFVLILLYCT